MEDAYEIREGDCREVMRGMDAESIDAIVCDPPYGLSFMGKGWDHGVPGVEFWTEAMRVAKPGAHLLAFGGTRTYHRLACAIEDAGWEIRDCVMWVYGSGFPKSHDVSKAIDKRGGSLGWQAQFAAHLRSIKPRALKASEINAHVSNGTKSNFWGHFIDTKSQPLVPTVAQYQRLRELLPIDPAWDAHFLPEAEREVLGQKRTGDPVAWFAQSDRGEGIVDITAPATDAARQWSGWGTALKPAWEPIIVARKPLVGTVAENVIAHGTGAINVDGCRVGTEQVFTSAHKTLGDGIKYGKSKPFPASEMRTGRWPANVMHDGSEEATAPMGEAARFFYCAKASKADRDEGLGHLPETQCSVGDPRPGGDFNERLGKTPGVRRNNHPTVKPTALMRYLCRLVTQPGGIVLDPFCGSGSTGKAARLEGFRFIGIERESDYAAIARARIAAVESLHE